MDSVYMTAVQLMTGRGGWPMTVVMTPGGEPFFAGTYFPPDDRGGRPGFRTVLTSINEAWTNRRDDVEAEAKRLGDAMRQVLEDQQAPAATTPGPEMVAASVDDLQQRFDSEWGGFGPAPKFPSPSNLLLLLEMVESDSSASGQALDMLAPTLDQMARGGLYDQVGGGFHRYATDREWRIPHFEKMLYDNGLLLEVYARWFALSRDPQAERVVRETAEFLAREMTSPEGALWSAIDAETEEREGAFYVWTRFEIDYALLGDARFLGPILGYANMPNFEEEDYVLHLPQTFEAAARDLDMTREDLIAKVAPLRAKLLEHRAKRQRPLTDDKILTDWNGMAIAGLATAGRLLDEPTMVAAAERAARFVLAHLRPKDAPLQHTWRGGVAKIDAYLDDYAFMLRGLLALELATGDSSWRTEAIRLADEMIERLGDAERGGFYAAVQRDDLLARTKPLSDGATPGGNAVALLALQDLATRTGDARWHTQTERGLRAFAPAAIRAPAAYRTFSIAVHRAHGAADVSPPPTPTATPNVSELLAAQTDDLVRTEVMLGGTSGDRWRPLTVTLSIAEGWHVNANPASDEFLIPTQLVPNDEIALRKPRYPKGHELALAFTDDPISVYDGTVEISAEASPLSGDATVELTFQACDDRRCLPPVRRVLTVPQPASDLDQGDQP